MFVSVATVLSYVLIFKQFYREAVKRRTDTPFPCCYDFYGKHSGSVLGSANDARGFDTE